MSSNLTMQVVLQALDKATAPLRGISQSSAGLGKQLRETRNQLRELQAQQSNVQSFKQLKAATGESANAMAAQQQKVKELAAQMQAADAPTKTLTRQFNAATKEAARLKTQHQANQQQLQGVRTQLSQAGISTRNLSEGERTLRGRIAETNAALDNQKSRLESVAASQAKLAAAKEQYERTQQMASNMATTGAAGLAAGGGALYAGARFMQTGIDFDSSMSEVQALARLDKQSDAMEKLRAQARQLGADTMFSASEAAQGMGFLAMAGFDPESIMQTMPGMLDLAKAGNLDLARTADIASNILTGMQMDASEMGRAGDVLVGAFTRSNTSLEMMGETMKYVAPVAASVGQDIETVAAMAGKLGDAGIQGSQGGTALRSIINRLSSPPTAAMKALDQLGIKTKDAAGNMRFMPDILTELYAKTKHMGTADRAAALKAIAGGEAVSALQVLVGQAGSGELQEFIEQLREAAGESAEVAAVMADNITGDLAGLNSAYEDLKISVFTEQNDAMREMVQTFTDLMRAAGAWAKENPELIARLVKVAAVVAVLVAAGGALLITAAGIIGPLAALKYGLAVLAPVIKGVGVAMFTLGKAMLANPVFLAIALLAAGAYLLYRNWDAVVDFFASIWGGIKEAFSGGVAGVSSLIINWSPLGLFYKAFAGVMSWFGIELPGKFTEFGGMLVSGLINGIKGMASKAKEAVVGVGENVTGWFKDKLGIRSPSRVFMALGGDTMAGLSLGLRNNQQGPLKQVAGLGKQLAAAGAIAFAGPALAGGLQFDSRPPINSAAPVIVGSAGDNITINVHAAPGMDTAELARLVQMELQKHQMQQQVRRRSTFGDLD